MKNNFLDRDGVVKIGNRFISMILLIALLVCLFFSYQYMIKNAKHDCSGEDCPICMQLEAAIQFVSSIKILPVLSFILAVLCVFTQLYTIHDKSFCVRKTLVSLKVELLD